MRAFSFRSGSASSDVVVDVLWAHAQRRKKPPVSVSELLKGLAAQAPRFVAEIRRVIDVRTDDQLREIADRLNECATASEYLVAAEDLLLADADFRREFQVAAEAKRKDIMRGFHEVLHEPPMQERMVQLFREWGVAMPRDELLALSADELELVLEKAGHRAQ